MQNIFIVFLGGGIGSALRYWSQGMVYRFMPSTFPYGTLAVNVSGSLFIGFLMTFFEERFLLNPSLRLFLTIGILGGFTTFSSFSYETIMLLKDGEIFSASVNIIISVVTCLAATYLGTIIGKLI